MEESSAHVSLHGKHLGDVLLLPQYGTNLSCWNHAHKFIQMQAYVRTSERVLVQDQGP